MWARIIEADGIQTIAEVINYDPSRFPSEIAAQFVPATDGMVYRATLVDGVWVAPPEPDATPEPEAPTPTRRTIVNRVEFKQLFTIAEQIAIKMARAYSGTDTAPSQLKFALDAFYDVLDDPQLQTINLAAPMVGQALAMLEGAGLIAEGRAAEIAEGVAR